VADLFALLNELRAQRGLTPLKWSENAAELRPATARILYRAVKSLEPTADEFLSNEELGYPSSERYPSAVLVWTSVSAFLTVERLLEQYRKASHIATIDIPEGSGILELPEKKRHVNLYGRPEELLSCVVDVKEVETT
jgi:hypothetical protein